MSTENGNGKRKLTVRSFVRKKSLRSRQNKIYNVDERKKEREGKEHLLYTVPCGLSVSQVTKSQSVTVEQRCASVRDVGGKVYHKQYGWVMGYPVSGHTECAILRHSKKRQYGSLEPVSHWAA